MIFYAVELSAVWNVGVPSRKYSRKIESPRVISRLWQRFQDDGNVSRRYSSGHPRITKPNEERYLAITVKRNRQSTASDLSRQPLVEFVIMDDNARPHIVNECIQSEDITRMNWQAFSPDLNPEEHVWDTLA
ncbi:uncharacterized protein TNCV_2018441 [Trichonephila clavipes]|nr:uncharacterized protein TNCV_2018441 [Trichonephila clavipes]